eukprot:610099_1
MAEEKQNTNELIQWQVTGDLLQQFKDSKHKKAFYSPQFNTIDGTAWRLQFYPHGYESPDDCSIYLECVKLNANKPQIGVNYSFNIMELDWCLDSEGATFKDGVRRGPTEAFKVEKLSNVDAITVKCFVEETMDVSDGNTYFEWKVNNHLLQQWKNAKYKKPFYSPSFN